MHLGTLSCPCRKSFRARCEVEGGFGIRTCTATNSDHGPPGGPPMRPFGPRSLKVVKWRYCRTICRSLRRPGQGPGTLTCEDVRLQCKAQPISRHWIYKIVVAPFG